MSEPAWRVEGRRLARRATEAGAARGRAGQEWFDEQATLRRADVVRERWASDRGLVGLDPAVGLAPDGDHWIDDPGDGTATRVGLDASGAIAVAVDRDHRGDERVVAVGWRLEDGTEVLVSQAGWYGLRVETRGVAADGSSVAVDVLWRDDDAGGTVPEVGVAVAGAPGRGRFRVDRAFVEPETGVPVPAFAVHGTETVVLGDDGAPVERRLDRLDRWWAGSSRGDNELTTRGPAVDDPVGLAELGLALLTPDAPAGTPELFWSRALHGRPPALPVAADETAAVERAAVLMRDLVVRAAVDVDLPAPCAVLLSWGTGGPLHLPPLPELEVLDAAFRDAYRRRPGEHRATTSSYKAHEAGEARRIDLAPLADDETLAAWRPLARADRRAAGTTAEERARVGERLTAVRRRLLVLLLEASWPEPWDGPVFPKLWFGPPVGGDDGIRGVDPDAEIRELGDPGVVARLDELWPVRARKRGSQSHHEGGGLIEDPPFAVAPAPRVAHPDGAPPPTQLEAVASRDAFLRLLRHHDLEDAAESLADAATWGFALMRATDRRAGGPPGDEAELPRSRFGGPPLLPPGEAWPSAADGEPLTFLAAVDLAEVPAIDEPTVLPTDGTLLIYVLVGGVDVEEEGCFAFYDHEPEDETAVVFHVPAGVAPVVVADPAAPLLGDDEHHDAPIDRPVVMRPVLVPLDAWGTEGVAGLHPSAQDVYEELTEDLVSVGRGGGGDDWWEGDEDRDDDPGASGASGGPVDPPPPGDRPHDVQAVSFLPVFGDDPETDPARLEAYLRTFGVLPGERGAEGASSYAGVFGLAGSDDGASPDGAGASASPEDEPGWTMIGRSADGTPIWEPDDDEPWEAGETDEPALPRSFGVLLGADPGVQGHGVGEGEIVLLSLDGDADVGLEWGDGGDLRVLIREEDARAGRWDRAWAVGDSG